MTRTAICLALAATLTLCGCGGGATLAPEAPPPERVEVRPPKPGPDYFWQQGRWVWRDGDAVYYWAGGGWVREREGLLWMPGTWRPVDKDGARVWEWVPDRWVRLNEDE